MDLAILMSAKAQDIFWLLLKNKLNTRSFLRRKNMYLDPYARELCILQKEERLCHLFFKCYCLAQIRVIVPTWLKPERATRHIKRLLKVPFAMEIIILVCWCIWSKRNVWIFNNEDSQIIRCKEHLKKEFNLVIHRSKGSRVPEMQS
jgi:hypothetical protein